MTSSLNQRSSVTIGYLLGGGVRMILKSRAPINENCNVLGMGVAVKVSVSTEALNVFNLSFVPTPNFCSSSIISNPRSLNFTSFPTNLWVPIIISVCPLANFSKLSLICLLDLKRLM